MLATNPTSDSMETENVSVAIDSINQDEINAILWKACDTFRGTVDPSEYKNYILVMLFVKYISDVWRDHYEQLQRQVRRRRATASAASCTTSASCCPKGADYYSLYEQRNAANLGELINMALEAIEDANKDKLEGVFRNIDFNTEAALGRTKQRNERLKNLLEDFHDPRLDLRPCAHRRPGRHRQRLRVPDRQASPAARARRRASSTRRRKCSQLLAELLDPQPGDRICDPACGSGSLLIKCAESDRQHRLRPLRPGDQRRDLGAVHDEHVPARHQRHHRQHRVGRHAQGPTADCEDSQTLMRFNVVVANPPFSLDKWGAENAAADRFNRFHRGVPPKSKGDYAFITHMIETTYLEPRRHGRVGVVVPHGVLFRGGSEGKIRKQLIEENLLDAVIGLPANLFYGTGIPAAILIFQRDKADDSVLFIDASREFEPGTNQNRLRAADLAKIVATYKAREIVDKYAYVADAGRDRGERLQPEHPPLRGHLRAGAAGGYGRGQRGDRGAAGQAGRGGGDDAGVFGGVGA